MSGPLSARMSVIALLNLLLIKTWPIWFAVVPSAEYYVSLWISSRGNVVLLTFKPLDIPNWIIFIPLLLVVSLCKFSLPVVGLYMFSLPTFALKSPSTSLMSELALRTERNTFNRFLRNIGTNWSPKLCGCRVNVHDCFPSSKPFHVPLLQNISLHLLLSESIVLW